MTLRITREQAALALFEQTKIDLKTDLWKLIHILYPPPDYQWDENVHRVVCDEFFVRKNPKIPLRELDTIKKRLWLDPRNHFKTTLDIADAVQWILCYPNVRILLASGTRDNAIKMLRAVKSHFQYNEAIRALFPELCPEARKAEDFGTQDSFICPGRLDKSMREPTCSVASPDSTVAGMHYEVLKFDDLVNETNSRTKEGINQVNNWFKLTNPLLERGGYRDVIGTRYDYSDLYGEILGDDYVQIYTARPIQHNDYRLMLRACHKPDGTILFANRFDEDFFIGERKEMGSFNFSAQYNNDPVPDDASYFPRDRVDKSFISRKDLPQRRSYFMTLDLAASQSDDADNNALVTCSIGWLKDKRDPILFIEDIYAGHILPEDMVSKMYEKCEKFKPAQIRTEEVAFTVLLRPLANMIATKRGFHLPLVWIKRDSKQSKEGRIAAMQPFFERGQIRIVDDCPFRDSLCTELIRFPKYKRRDIADALADHLEFMEMFNSPPETESVQFAAPRGNARLGLMA